MAWLTWAYIILLASHRRKIKCQIEKYDTLKDLQIEAAMLLSFYTLKGLKNMIP